MRIEAEIRALDHARSRDDSRPIMAGVCIKGGHLCATDSYRAALVPLSLIHPTPDGATNAVIPGEAVKALCDRKTATIALNGRVSVEWGTYSRRKGEEWEYGDALDYPTLTQLVPDIVAHHRWETPAGFAAEISTLAGCFVSGAHVVFSDWGDPAVAIQNGPTLGTPSNLEGVRAPVHIGLNLHYFADMLEWLGKDGAIYVKDGLKPIVGRRADGATYLLMPIRLS